MAMLRRGDLVKAISKAAMRGKERTVAAVRRMRVVGRWGRGRKVQEGEDRNQKVEMTGEERKER